MRRTTESDSNYDGLEKMSVSDLLININREDTRVMGEGSHIVLIADTIEFNGGDSKFKKLTSHADLNIFLSSDTFNVMRVNAGSYNGIADSIMIERNLFIEDTISDITTFTKYDDFGGWGAGVSLGQGFSSLDKAKIYNNSTNDFCLENVSIEYVDVISSNYTNNYIKLLLNSGTLYFLG